MTRFRHKRCVDALRAMGKVGLARLQGMGLRADKHLREQNANSGEAARVARVQGKRHGRGQRARVKFRTSF